MKSSLLLLLLVVLPVSAVHAQGDEPDLVVSPRGAGPKRSSRPAKKTPATQATAAPESRPVSKPRSSLIQIDRETKKIVTPKIHFLPTKTNLTPLAKKVLKHLAQELTAEPGLQIQIEAHTDELGSDRFNQELSQQQADTVKAFLVESGVANTRLQAVGQGDTKLLDESRTPLAQASLAQAKNRRVEFVITGEVAAPAAVETQPETSLSQAAPTLPPSTETIPTPVAPTVETLPTTPPLPPAETQGQFAQPETTPTSALPPPPPPATPTPTTTIPVISLPTIPTTPETQSIR